MIFELDKKVTPFFGLIFQKLFVALHEFYLTQARLIEPANTDATVLGFIDEAITQPSSCMFHLQFEEMIRSGCFDR